MMKWRSFSPVLIVISLCILSGCAELYELREIKTTQDAKMQQLENQDKQSKNAIYNLKVEKERDQIKFREQNETLQKEIRDLKEKRSEREQILADENFILSRKLQSYENQLNTAQTEIKKQKDEFSLFKSESESAFDKKEKDIRNLGEEKQSLIRQSTEFKSNTQKIEDQIAEKDKLLKKLEKQLSDRDSLVTDLTAQLNDLKTQVKTIKSAQTDKTYSGTDTDTTMTSLLDQAEAKFQKILSDDFKTNKIKTKRNNQGLIIHLYSDDLFEKGTVIIGDDAKPLLLKVSLLISQTPGFDVYVEGHTDNTPIENLPFLDNLALSSARADNVLRFLIEEGRIDKRRVQSVACSWFHPVASNDIPEGRRENRRVEIILQPQ